MSYRMSESKPNKEKRKHKRREKSENDADDSSSAEEILKKRKSKHKKSCTSDDEDAERSSRKTVKKHKKEKKSKKRRTKDPESDLDIDDENEKWQEVVDQRPPMQRESWMSDTSSLMLKTYQRERVEKQPNEKQQIAAYDPATSSRELNPYWKTTGTGLPSFQKPRDMDEHDQPGEPPSYAATSGAKNWQKKSVQPEIRSPSPPIGRQERVVSVDTSATATESARAPPMSANDFAAKILKAELMGDMERAKELKAQMQKAKEERNSVKEPLKKPQEEHILLTHTDEKGNTRPLPASSRDASERYGPRRGGKERTKRVETHENGQRVRYFADDDRYDINQMFEREKSTNAAQSNLQFAQIAGQHKNPNDDLEDIFADQVRKSTNVAAADKRATQQAITQHQRMSAQLDNCINCVDSSKMNRDRLVCMGEKIYLALPLMQGLVPGHCLLVPTQHVTCCTQLDEDAWEEMCNFRKALTQMFIANGKEVIFYEIANKLQRQPHLQVHCIPVPYVKAEAAPFYFKKAIEESEQEWSVNKQLVTLKDKSLRRAIPKGLPYVWVNFAMDQGFAHVIEEQNRFPENFAQEIIGGMLNLNATKWRKPHKELDLAAKVKEFNNMWRKYDCTK